MHVVSALHEWAVKKIPDLLPETRRRQGSGGRTQPDIVIRTRRLLPRPVQPPRRRLAAPQTHSNDLIAVIWCLRLAAAPAAGGGSSTACATGSAIRAAACAPRLHGCESARKSPRYATCHSRLRSSPSPTPAPAAPTWSPMPRPPPAARPGAMRPRAGSACSPRRSTSPRPVGATPAPAKPPGWDRNGSSPWTGGCPAGFCP